MTSWRDVYPVHPAADALPMLADADLRELGEDIKKHGLRTPVVLWTNAEREGASPKAYLLDGRNRLDAMELVGMITTEAGDEGQYRLSRQIDAKYLDSTHTGTHPAAYVITANLRRRHLRPRDLVLHAMAIRTAAMTGGRSEPLRGAEYRDATGTLRQTRPNDRVSAKGGRGHKGEATEIAEQTGVPARTVRRVLREEAAVSPPRLAAKRDPAADLERGLHLVMTALRAAREGEWQPNGAQLGLLRFAFHEITGHLREAAGEQA